MDGIFWQLICSYISSVVLSLIGIQNWSFISQSSDVHKVKIISAIWYHFDTINIFAIDIFVYMEG